MIDLDTFRSEDRHMIDLAADLTVSDLKTLTNASVDRLLSFIESLNDDDVTFEPHDPNAHDPYAVPGEENIGWSIAHLVAHVTASSEEGAAFSSLLARGVLAKDRPRYETPWRDITTKAQCVARLEESRRMRLAYLDTWPDAPFLDVYREVSEKFEDKFGRMNAPAAFLFGLRHEVGHFEQFQEVTRQIEQARTTDV